MPLWTTSSTHGRSRHCRLRSSPASSSPASRASPSSPSPRWLRIPWRGPRRACPTATFFFFLIGLLLPFQLALLPLYIQMRDLGLLGSIWSLVIIYTGVQMPFSIFLITTFLRSSVPLDFEEAARIDGCGNIRVLWHVVVPLLRPVLGTLHHPQRCRDLERLLHAADLPRWQQPEDDPDGDLRIRRSRTPATGR